MIGNNEVLSVHLMKSRSNTKNIDALTYMAGSNYIKELNKMDNKEKILKSIESAKKTVEELQKYIKELEEQLNNESNKRKPMEGDVFYYISNRGTIESDVYTRHEFDERKIQMGNYFKTKKEAEFELEKIKIRAELKEFSFKPNWNARILDSKYYIYYDNMNKKLCVDSISYMQDDIIYFKSRDVAEKAIEKVGEGRIKKYLFGKE